MKTNNKILLADFVEFIYHYPELDFWFAIEKFKERYKPPVAEEPVLPAHEETE